MKIPPKDIDRHIFTKVDSDTAPENVKNTDARYMLNVETSYDGEKGIVVNSLGNALITTPLHAGVNKCIGWGASEETNKFYFFVANDQGYDTVFVYDELQNVVNIVLQDLTDTNGVRMLNFSTDNLILHVDIVQDNLIYWVDGVNKARKFNIAKAMDKSATGYGNIIIEDYITAYKKAPIYAPQAAYTTDLTRKSNYHYGILTQYIGRHIYDDGEKSTFSDYSLVPLPPNQSYLGADKISYENNCVQITVETGNSTVKKIELAVKIGSLPFQSITVLNKADLGIPDNSQYVYNFFNDVPLTALSDEDIIRPYSWLPLRPLTQAFTKNAIVYTGGIEGWTELILDAKVDVTYEPLYIPDGTNNQLNSPVFTVINDYHIDKAHYWHTTGSFTVGVDVKKGNVYTIWANTNVKQDRYKFTYKATDSDSASTVANTIKSFLRSIGRGIPDRNNGISSENIDGSGNVTWNHFSLGGYNEGPTVWFTSVTPVSFDSLKDNGLSINAIKSGAARQYAFLYIDDDGVTSLGYTNFKLQARSQSINERQASVIERPVHTITINHKPPIRARWWQLLRTADQDNYIQMLIQQVIDVTTVDSVDYLDLVVGSLFTYQKLHENTILQYTFEKGDRISLIRKTSDNSLYPQFETEILSYKVDTEDIINANVTIDGTDSIQVADGAKADFVGKNVLINGYERTIIAAIDGSHYRLDQPIAAGAPTTYSTYTLIDRRGIIRIRKPDPAIVPVVADDSLVQISKPILNISEDFQSFQAFGKKFEVGNYGTDQRVHYADVQSQTASLPAIVRVIEGDAYWRNRELPTNNVVPGTQVKIEQIEDPNFSDFFESNLHSLGRVYPKDDGRGEKRFTERARFSNNYIEDTSINGLNMFDNLDRNDYNDSYGTIMLIRFRDNRLYIYKLLKTGWALVGQTIIQDNSGTELVGTASKLLSAMQYFAWEGGIGNNPESWTSNGNFQYFASPNSGVFIRLGGDGADPISSIYLYDKRAREVLNAVNKYNLRIYGGFDREKSKAIWHVPSYNEYLYDSGFNANEWSTLGANLPNGTTFVINAQPANSTAVLSGTQVALAAGTVLGDDFFTYTATLPDATTIGPRKRCFTVIAKDPNRPSSFVIDQSSSYCERSNTGVDPFSFTPVTNASLNTAYTTSSITITGPFMPVPVTISAGGVYRKNGGPYVSTPTTAVDGDTFILQQMSSTNNSTTTSITLTVGDQSGTFNVTTGTIAVAPFTFTDVTNATLSTNYISNSITVSGNTLPSPISIVQGSYSINGGAFTTADGFVNAGDTVRVQRLSSGSQTTVVGALLTIDGQSDTFGITTGTTTITPFGFITQTEVQPSTLYSSDIISPTGNTIGVPISISGGEYALNAGAYTSSAGTFNPGDTVIVRQTSSPTIPTATTVLNLNINGTIGQFSLVTYHICTVNLHVTEQSSPYADGNLQVKNNAVIISTLNSTGTTGPIVIQSRLPMSAEAFSELPSTGVSPQKTLDAKLGGTSFGGYPQTNSDNPGDPSLVWTGTGLDNGVYDFYNTAYTTSTLPPDAVGILQIDILGPSTLELCAYLSSLGYAPSQMPVYQTTNNFYPNTGIPVEAMYALASDMRPSNDPKFRFQFNIAALLSQYPSATTFQFIVRGRDVTAGNINGSYSLKGADAGKMVMNGSPGTYLPATSGATTIGNVAFTGKPVTNGANGAYGVAVGNVVLTFDYNVLTKTMVLT